MTGLDLEPLLDELADRVADRLRPLLAMPPAGESWRLLDVEQAADRLGRSTRWVRERAKRGDLPFVRLDGGGLAFEEADLRAFAQARRVSAEEPEVLADRLQAHSECDRGRLPLLEALRDEFGPLLLAPAVQRREV